MTKEETTKLLYLITTYDYSGHCSVGGRSVVITTLEVLSVVKFLPSTFLRKGTKGLSIPGFSVKEGERRLG